MIGPVIGVLFDGFAYGMLLFLLSVGLSVTLGMMNFVNLAHCAFAMLGGYVTVTLMNGFGWPFLATLPFAFLSAALVSVVFERDALPPALSRERSRPGAAHDRAGVHVGRGRGLYLRHHPAAGADAVLSARLGRRLRARASASTGCSWSRSRSRSRCSWSLALEYTRFGAQVRAAVDNQRMARGLGINVDAPSRSPSRSAAGLRASAARSRSRSSASIRPSRFTYLVYVLIVVSVGGLGSIGGSFAAADAARHQRRRRQVLRARARRLPDLSGHGRAADVAARRACSGGADCRSLPPRSPPHAYLRAPGRAGTRSRSCSGSRTLLPFLLFPTTSSLASQIAITALFALSLDLILGYAGIVSLGHAAFFGLGAYTAGLVLQARLGRAAHRPDRSAAVGRGHRRLPDELHRRALPPPRADHDHARHGPAAARGGQQRALAHRRRRRPAGRAHLAAASASSVRPLRLHRLRLLAGRAVPRSSWWRGG